MMIHHRLVSGLQTGMYPVLFSFISSIVGVLGAKVVPWASVVISWPPVSRLVPTPSV